MRLWVPCFQLHLYFRYTQLLLSGLSVQSVQSGQCFLLDPLFQSRMRPWVQCFQWVQMYLYIRSVQSDQSDPCFLLDLSFPLVLYFPLVLCFQLMQIP